MSLKKINEKKLEAFTLGAMGKRPLSRKELEDQKKREEEAAAAHAFKEFVETFQEPPTSTKVWIKAGTYDAGSRREDKREKGKLYIPGKGNDEKTTAERAQEYAKMLASDTKKDTLSLKKKSQEKKKSNLELFKEELRQIQEEREERHKYKHIARQTIVNIETDNTKESNEIGSFDNGDPNTTNLYLGNLSPKISEQQLMELFGRYGPLASIKIMWPRSEEEKSRGRNCGFVAYMSRKDAERALKTLHGRDVMGYEMRLGWGKAVPILNQPIFIPPTMLELTLPPPPSGLPFNAQPSPNETLSTPPGNYKEYADDEEKTECMKKILYNAIVKVCIPTEKTVLCVIHRMIEFVIREGPMFEALVMSREMENPLFSFLFDNESPAHIYYRWKLFSLLQGDSPNEWREKEFRMFKGGPIWKPPSANFYTQGMSDELVVDDEAPEPHKGALSNAQRDRLEDLIRHLTPERSKIGDVMIFCIEHAEAADEICECIAESLANSDTLCSKKIARLYLFSDLLHNCTVKVSNASFFRKAVEKQLVEVFENLHNYYTSMDSRLKGEGFKARVLKVIRAWEEWTIYQKEFLSKLKAIFLGLPTPKEETKKEEEDPDIDGAPMSGDEKDDEDLNGVPLDGAALLKGALMRALPETIPIQKDAPIIQRTENNCEEEYDDDIDGIPLDDDIDGIPIDKFGDSPKKGGAFIPSKWETIDPEQVEAQAITTSKWDTLEPPAPPEPPKFYDSNDSSEDENAETSRDFSEEKRTKLREIEMKSMQYQDELESGKRDVRPGWTISQQVEHYRKRLLKKDLQREELDSPSSFLRKDTTRRTPSPSGSTHSKKSRHAKRSPSPPQHSARSSPPRSKRRSRSPTYSSSKREASPSSRYSKHLKRNRSRSLSDSPKRFLDRIPYSSKSSKYEDSPPQRSKRSPSFGRVSPPSSRSRRSPVKSSKLEVSPKCSRSRSPSSRHRSDKHKHKHKH